MSFMVADYLDIRTIAATWEGSWHDMQFYVRLIWFGTFTSYLVDNQTRGISFTFRHYQTDIDDYVTLCLLQIAPQ